MTTQLKKILLVEDDEIDIMAIERAFKKNKINSTLYIARNGQEAMQLLKGENASKILPQVILLDINMPRMGGIAFLEKLRADEELKAISVVIVTTSSEESDKVAAYNLNVAGYIVKPLSFETVMNTIEVLNEYWDLCEQL